MFASLSVGHPSYQPLASAVSGPTVANSSSWLTLSLTDDGAVAIEGIVRDEDAVIVRGVLDEATERVLDRHRRDVRASGSLVTAPTRAEARAEALSELLISALTKPDGRLRISLSVACDTDGTLMTSSGAVVGRVAAGGARTLPSDGLLRWMAARSSLSAMHFDAQRNITAMGHPVRSTGQGLAMALRLRDGGCVFPGCDETPDGCAPFHVTDTDDNAPSDPANVALVCTHHMRFVTDGRWSFVALGDQWFEWVTVAGARLRSQRHGTRPEPDARDQVPSLRPRITSVDGTQSNRGDQ